MNAPKVGHPRQLAERDFRGDYRRDGLEDKLLTLNDLRNVYFATKDEELPAILANFVGWTQCDAVGCQYQSPRAQATHTLRQ